MRIGGADCSGPTMSPTANRLHKPVEAGYAQSAHKLPPQMQEDSRSFVQRISPSHLLLLKASLLEGHAALAAYREWRPTLDLTTITYGQQRLLPLLQRNLIRLGIEDPLIDRFRGIRRYFWVRNLNAMTFAQGIFAALDRVGVPFIVLKGAALVACYLDDRSLRPMDDIDILIPEDRLADAVAVLTKLELRPSHLSIRDILADGHLRSLLSGEAFFRAKQVIDLHLKQVIDLHWKAMDLDRSPHADDRFWQARREASLGGTRITVLDPAHQLLHIFAHAAPSDAGSAVYQWPADAALIIRGEPDLCFGRLIAEAKRRRLSAIAAEALGLLANELNLPIPQNVIKQLRAASSWMERREMRLLAGGSASHTAPLIVAFQDFLRNDAEVARTARAFPEFLKVWTGVAKTGPAFLIAAQAITGWPAWLRRLSGRDCYRVTPNLNGLPQIGDTLDLVGTEIDGTPLISGWSIPEPTGRWTLGHEATIAWDVRGQEEDLTIRVDGYALLHEKVPLQKIELWANDRRIANWRFNTDTASPLPARISIPRKLIRNRDVLMLTFLIRNPVCPAENGMAPDRRRLGFHLRSLTLKKRLPKVGDTLDLAATEIDDPPLIAGWSGPEPTGRWTLGHEATIAWDVRGQEEDLTIRVDGDALLHEKVPLQDIELWANDRRIASWRFQYGEVSPLPARLSVPRELIRNRDVLKLTFLTRNPVCPAELGISPDARALGFRLRSLTLMKALEVDRLPKVGDTLDLAATEIDDPPLIAGWSGPEPTGRWTLGHEATIAWDVRGQEEDLTIRVDGDALLHEKVPLQDIELWANDRRIANWRFQYGEVSPLPARLSVPRELMRNRDVLKLTFLIRNPVCPAESASHPMRVLSAFGSAHSRSRKRSRWIVSPKLVIRSTWLLPRSMTPRSLPDGPDRSRRAVGPWVTRRPSPGTFGDKKRILRFGSMAMRCCMRRCPSKTSSYGRMTGASRIGASSTAKCLRCQQDFP